MDFLRYQLSTNTWEVLTSDPTPQAVNYGSLTFNETENLIYAFRGNGTTDFWKFDPAATAGQGWIGPKQFSNTAGTLQALYLGSDVIWNKQAGANSKLYTFQGNNTANFFVYNTTGNSWTTGAPNPSFTIRNDMKGEADSSGNIYMPRYSNASIIQIFNGTTWSAMTAQPTGATATDGAGLAFVGNDIYYIRGGANPCMYRYNSGLSTPAWGSCIATAINTSGQITTYYPYIGARITSDGTDVYMFPGDGETAFLKYTVSSGTWSNLTKTPFSQHYGSDMTYDSNNSKIYALAGLYKDETWEYDITANAWRHLPNSQKFTFGRGPERGASIEYAGGSSIYATIGQGVGLPSASADMWSFTVPTNNYPTTGTNTYVSDAIDLGQVSSGTSFSFNQDTPANTSVTYELCSNADQSACTSWHNITDGVISDLTISRYAYIKITLSTSNGTSTPTVYDYTISYASSDTNPSVPENLVSSSERDGEAILTDNEYTHEHPYFSWTAGEDNGSGVAGYYVYFGKNSEANPITDGVYQTATNYSVNEAMNYDTDPVHNYGTYYLIIKAKDNNNLVSDAWSPFIYKYKGVSPEQTVTKSLQDDFNKTGADFDSGKISYSSVDGSLRLNNVSGFWNQSRLSASPYYTYIGGELAMGECKTAGEESLNGNHCLYTFQGNNTQVLMRYEIETDTWINSTANPTELDLAPLGIYNGGTITEGPEGYLYASRGVSQPTFWRYDIANHRWLQMDDAPKIFTYGSILNYDGSRYIYMTPGGDDAFYRFDTCNEQDDCTPEWTQMENADFGNPNTSDGQKTSYGADSIYDGRNNIYVLQGGFYPYFAKYSIADDGGHGETEDAWTTLPAAPIGFYIGGSMEFDGDHTIYALSGNNRMKFLKYDINTETWSFLPDAPSTIYYGASMKYYNGYLYTTRGGTSSTAFYRFNIATNTWELPNRDFFGPHDVSGSVYFPFSNGALMADDGNGNIYLGRGAYDNTFGKYDTSTGSFNSLADLPIGAYNGSNIVYNGTESAIYYVSGSGIRTRRTGTDTTNPYFYKYDIETNSWTEITTDRPPALLAAGSSMAYDGSQYIYLTQGGSTTWWRYDTDGSPGSRWQALSTTGSCTSGNGSKIIYKDETIYRISAGNSRTNCKISGDFEDDSWTTSNLLPANVNYGASLIDGKDGYLYVTQGGNTNPNNYYRYDTNESNPDWEALSVIPGQATYGGIGTNASSRNWVITGAGGGTTYSDGLYSYVVSSSANGTGFEKTGTYTSESIDLAQAYRFANLTANYTLPANTSLEIQTRTSANNSNWGSWSTVSDDHTSGNTHRFSINSNPERYIQAKMIFSSSDQIYSPKLDDFSINYYQDLSAPSNPTSISAYSTSTKTTPIVTDTWYGNEAPYFEWPAAETAGGAADNSGGSGVAGYYVYFGTEIDGEPSQLQTETNYTAAGMTSGQYYYLRIQAIDNAGMVPVDIYPAFIYRYDSVAPSNPSTTSVNPTGYSSASLFTFTWADDSVDANSQLAKFQYRTGGDEAGVWTDIPDPATVSIQAEPYQPNKNTFYLRAVDNAGNASVALIQDYYYSGGAASPPTILTVDPDEEDNADNEFTFTWDLPESYSGDPSKLKYYYSVNARPTAYNTIETTAKAAGPGPFATQYGENIFYVVALNEGGLKTNSTDIDWVNPAQVLFYAETSAPGSPLNVQIFDTSDRESAEYSLALKWSTPASYDPGNFAGYAIYRSDDNVDFEEIATTTGSAYVDTELESKLYYYYVKSKDKTNNFSIATSTVELIPTGRYTSPPDIVTEPAISVASFAATIAWSTNRVASSFIEYGTSITLGQTNGQIDSVTSHTVNLTGLNAATKYYYRVKFVDPDGNIGTSVVSNFTTNDPPTISDVVTSEVGLSTANISWTTNMSGTCTLKYGKGSFTNTVEESAGGTTHIQKLSILESATQYLYQIECLDADLNSFSSDQYAFTTLEQPRVENMTVQNKEAVDIPTIAVGYTTTHPTSTLVKFKGSSESSYHNYLVNDLSTEHSATIEGLDPAIEYEVIASGIDSNGIEAATMSAKVTTLTDSRPPGLTTNRAVGRVTGRGKDAKANLYVKIETDETTKTKVLFGKGTILNNFEQSTAEDPANTYHLVTIPVDPGQVYSYVVEAVDMADNKTNSNSVTVVVEGAKDNATEIVVNTFSNKFGWVTKLWQR
jgi:hypothetical protein